LEYASSELRGDKEMLFKAFNKCGVGVTHSMSMEEMVLIAVNKDGMLLGCAPDKLRSDKKVVKQAVKNSGFALKFAKPPLNQDLELLKDAGIFYNDYENGPRMAILSVKFSLNEKSTTYANEFALSMNVNHGLKHFKSYYPNLRSKPNCADNLDYTSLRNSCQGTLETCKFPDSRNLTTDATTGKQRPMENSCWRVSYGFLQEQCKANNGFMIQVDELEGPGPGQIIETRMAEQVGLKVFRTFTDKRSVDSADLNALASAIQAWLGSNRANMDLEEVWVGDGIEPPPGLLEQRRRW